MPSGVFSPTYSTRGRYKGRTEALSADTSTRSRPQNEAPPTWHEGDDTRTHTAPTTTKGPHACMHTTTHPRRETTQVPTARGGKRNRETGKQGGPRGAAAPGSNRPGRDQQQQPQPQPPSATPANGNTPTALTPPTPTHTPGQRREGRAEGTHGRPQTAQGNNLTEPHQARRRNPSPRPPPQAPARDEHYTTKAGVHPKRPCPGGCPHRHDARRRRGNQQAKSSKSAAHAAGARRETGPAKKNGASIPQAKTAKRRPSPRGPHTAAQAQAQPQSGPAKAHEEHEADHLRQKARGSGNRPTQGRNARPPTQNTGQTGSTAPTHKRPRP